MTLQSFLKALSKTTAYLKWTVQGGTLRATIRPEALKLRIGGTVVNGEVAELARQKIREDAGGDFCPISAVAFIEGKGTFRISETRKAKGWLNADLRSRIVSGADSPKGKLREKLKKAIGK